MRSCCSCLRNASLTYADSSRLPARWRASDSTFSSIDKDTFAALTTEILPLVGIGAPVVHRPHVWTNGPSPSVAGVAAVRWGRSGRVVIVV